MKTHVAAATFLLVTVFLNCTSVRGCSEPSFYTDSPFGNNSFVFGFGDAATITAVFRCNFTYWSYMYIKTYWKRHDRTEILWRMEFYRKLYFDEYEYNTKDKFNISWSISSTEIEVVNTFISIQKTANQSAVLFSDEGYYRYEVQTPSITVRCCDSTSEQVELVNASNGNDCVEESLGVCREGNAFHSRSGEYLPSVKLKCHRGRWTGEFECLQSCPQLQGGKFLTAKSFPRYKVGTILTIKCAREKMYTKKPPKRFVESSEITCTEKETWSGQSYVDCWEGSVVNFLSDDITLHSGEDTVFACNARNPLRSTMLILDQRIYGEETTWANITMTSDHNGVVATCRETDAFNKTQYERKTHLNVLYQPELLDDVAPVQKFELYSSGHVIITFRANPSLNVSDINVFKDGTKVSNYYLQVDNSHHKIVLDFDKVLEGDFGDYVITITSSIPVNSTLLVGVEVARVESSRQMEQSSGNISAIVLAVLLVIFIAGTVGYVIFKRKQKMPQAEKKNPDANATYEGRDFHNYEDIDQADRVRYHQSDQHAGYVNISPAQSSQRGQRSEQKLPLSPSIATIALPKSGAVRHNQYVMESPYDC